MASKQLLECSFLIPIHRDRNLSDGQAHKRSAWTWLHSQLLDFGGATRDLHLKEGWYSDPDTGERVTDRSRNYQVALARAEVGALRVLLREACAVFAQKCIYLSIAGHVEFVKGPSHESG